MRSILCILFALLAVITPIKAATKTASTASRPDVLIAYNACSDGDTLAVPAGSSTWGDTLVIQKRLTVQGAEKNGTVLTTLAGLPLFRIYTNNVRVTGFGFNGNHQNTSNQGLLQVGNTASTSACDDVYTIRDFRIDQCRFFNVGDNDLVGGLTGYPAVMISGYCYGVLDHNIFDNCYGECLDIGADGTGNKPGKPLSLQRSLSFGGYTNGTIYIEDNVWNYNLAISAGNYGAENAIDGNSGSRWVMRYNTFNVAANTKVQALISNHETCAARSCDGVSQGDVGSLSMEIYGNTVNNSGTAPNFGVYQFVHQRSGRALIYSNSIAIKDTVAAQIVRVSNFRSYHRLGCGAVAARGYAEVAHEVTVGKVSEGLDAAKTTLNGAIDSSVATVSLTSISGFNTNGLANGFSIRIGLEQIDYTGISGNRLTGCIRGVNGTSAVSHPHGASVGYLKFGVALEQINNSQVWANTTVSGVAKNAVEIGGDKYPPDYTFYDIRSYSQRPNNWQYRNDGATYKYTPHPYPHPLVAGTAGQTNPIVAIAPNRWDYGSVAVGAINDLAFTVRNMGGGSLAGVVSVPAPFSIVGNAGYALESNASQIITVRYAPIQVGENSQTVTFTGGGGARALVTGSAGP